MRVTRGRNPSHKIAGVIVSVSTTIALSQYRGGVTRRGSGIGAFEARGSISVTNKVNNVGTGGAAARQDTRAINQGHFAGSSTHGNGAGSIWIEINRATRTNCFLDQEILSRRQGKVRE